MLVGTIRAAIKASLASLDVHTYAAIPDAPVVPAIVISPRPYDFGMNEDSQNVQFLLTCLVSTVNMEAVQQTLDGWISDEGDTSIERIIRDDPSLGGVVSDASVTRMDAYRPVTIGPDGVRYLAADLILDVFT